MVFLGILIVFQNIFLKRISYLKCKGFNGNEREVMK